jgi:hypothetical protein
VTKLDLKRYEGDAPSMKTLDSKVGFSDLPGAQLGLRANVALHASDGKSIAFTIDAYLPPQHLLKR